MEEMRPAGHGVSNVRITFKVACHSCLLPFNALIPSPDRNRAALLGSQASADSESEARRNQRDSMLLRNQQLCSTCQEMKMVQPRTVKIPDDPKVSFENFMSHRMMSLHQPKFQTTPEPFHDDIPTESIHYRLPILGPRTAVFHGILTEAYKTLKERQRSSLPRKEPIAKMMRQ
uniref:Chromosome 1 open reading frame 105 n=1 Tax=Rhinopithecus roxellana TaxID=61622 RepID=A0A2K6P9D1_RHIRO